jgi:DNA mismatch repair ATPase MutS
MGCSGTGRYKCINIGFKVSSRWIQKFKTIHNIVSRKITKVVTKKSVMSNVDFEEKRNTFIENVKHQITVYGVENIYNSDQSGFQKF